MKITAAVVHERSGPFSLEEVELGEPGPREVRVRMVAVGLCHTDLVARDQLMPFPLPAVLGHEGAGIVENVGRAVTSVAPGDHVVLSYASCGDCAGCYAGHPAYCERFVALNFGGSRSDGSVPLSKAGQPLGCCFFGQSSFATHAVVHERGVVKVPPDAPLALLAPLGCGIQTGAGTVLNVLRPEAGSGIAVFGAGAVGLAAVMAAAISGCDPITVVDVVPTRLALARELGATHTINGKEQEAVAAIRGIGGVRYSIEATGNPALGRQAVDCLLQRGVCALVGVAAAGVDVALNIDDMLLGRTVIGTTEGDATPQKFIPQLVNFYLRGRLPLEKLVTTYDFADINRAVEDSEAGRTIKAVLSIAAP